jgi:hypothetical protein
MHLGHWISERLMVGRQAMPSPGSTGRSGCTARSAPTFPPDPIDRARDRRGGIMALRKQSAPVWGTSSMSGERVGFRFKHADPVVKRNPQGRSRRGWVMEPVEQTTSRGTKMPA